MAKKDSLYEVAADNGYKGITAACKYSCTKFSRRLSKYGFASQLSHKLNIILGNKSEDLRHKPIKQH